MYKSKLDFMYYNCKILGINDFAQLKTIKDAYHLTEKELCDYLMKLAFDKINFGGEK